MINVQVVITAVGQVDRKSTKSASLRPNSTRNIDDTAGLNLVLRTYSKICNNLNVVISDYEDEIYQLGKLVLNENPSVRLQKTKGLTAGAMCSALLGINYNLQDLPLIIAPGDSVTVDETKSLIEQFVMSDVDAATVVFKSTDPKYSYVRVNSKDEITEIAEKRVISTWATTGLFYFKNVATFLEGAKWALVNSSSLNDQYFTSNSFHWLIANRKLTSVAYLSDVNNYISFKDPSKPNYRLEK